MGFFNNSNRLISLINQQALVDEMQGLISQRKEMAMKKHLLILMSLGIATVMTACSASMDKEAMKKWFEEKRREFDAL